MTREVLLERFFEVLISGHRPSARAVVEDARSRAMSHESIVTDLFWPAYALIDRLYRSDQISRLSHHVATRLLRVLVDQNAAAMPARPANGRSIFAVCGRKDEDELGAQMAVDLLEAAGFNITFAGGEIENDEILARVNEDTPDVLLMFASGPQDLPNTRHLIDTLREIGACPGLQIAVGAGVFNRADGLAEEIGADVWAASPLEMVTILTAEPKRRAAADQRTVGRNRRVRSAA